MIRSMEELTQAACSTPALKMAVACAEDAPVLDAVKHAYDKNIIIPVLIGDKQKIFKEAETAGISIDSWEIIDIPDKKAACEEAVRLASEGKISLIMKGMVDTSIIMKAVLNKEYGLYTGGVLSHVGVLEVAGFDRLFAITDSAINIAPDLDAKVSIIKNAVEVEHALGNEMPKVAALCAVEKVNPKMECTLDAAKLEEMNKEGLITGCLIGGPFALDNAVSKEAAAHKGITSPLAGNADVLFVPDLEAGNLLIKAMEYFGHARKAGVIMGARIPIALTSRATAPESKMYTIAISKLIATLKEARNA
ncbi:MAG: bifunctional enoyl-CoA hydratase/phosphate acetyltransferase [Lachnospiraceae bacterium]|nr:bifunctional enoyl-CoA hydratase/phosphate acetyltransferase [Lachnospiraceae bacterium]